MGSILGKTISVDSGLSPAYEVLGKRVGYELRAYPPYVVAEVKTRAEAGTEDDSFRVLAKYIGVFGNAANKVRDQQVAEQISMTAPVVTGGSETIAMTAPVVTGGSETIAMTAPVVTGAGATASGSSQASSADAAVAAGQVMQFIMPAKYKSISDLPTPTDSRVTLHEVPEVLYLVRQFSGAVGKETSAATERERAETELAVKNDAGAFADYVKSDAKYLLARYNPPFTLPFLRRNELWFPLPLSREEIQAKIPST